jgi:alkylation response protein AidB-like acyl-CoA dehydrogenase
MLLDVELAKSAAYYAAAALDDGDNDAAATASLAKACAGEAGLQTAIHAVQIHGGIGFTWDNDTHLWYKRARSSEVLFGDSSQHREQMMQYWAAA